MPVKGALIFLATALLAAGIFGGTGSNAAVVQDVLTPEPRLDALEAEVAIQATQIADLQERLARLEGGTGDPPQVVSTAVGPTGEVADVPRATATGNKDDPIAIGQYARLENWRVAVLSATRNATDIVLGHQPYNEVPRTGYQYVLIRVQQTHVADGEGSGVDVMFVAVADSGNKYPLEDARCGEIPSPLPRDKVQSGNALEGNICFEVLVTDADSLKLTAYRLQTYNEVTWFALG